MAGTVRLRAEREAIPDDLKDWGQWVCWRVEERDGDPTKLPVNAETGELAKASDRDDIRTARETWSDFETAWSYHSDPETDTAGVGFVFDPDGPFAGVDLDDCRDPDGPSIEPWAQEILKTLDTYAEVSPSGTGVHAILRGEVPDGGNRKGGVEIYDSARYFTVTGAHLGLTPTTIEERQDALEAVHAEYIADSTPEDVADVDVTPGGTSTSGDLDDEELIEVAKAASNGEKFSRLWSGDTSGYPSHSEADQALCNLLAFYAGPDPRRIDRLFRKSGLVRVKWRQRDDYRERTIRNALQGRTEFYEPSSRSGSTDRTESDGELFRRFKEAFERYELDASKVAMVTGEDGEKFPIGLRAVLPDAEDEADIGQAVMAFNRKASKLSGTERQAVIGHVIRRDLEAVGEFFKTPDSRLFYFFEAEREVYRVDGEGKSTFDEDFRGLVWERYNLFAGRFSRNLGKDIRTKARRGAPVKPVYRFAHYDEDATELYVTDWGHGYYAISPDGLEWRPNGSDVYFLTESYADSYEYLDPEDRPDLPDDLPGERSVWRRAGDPIMRMFGNRVNYDETAALGPDQQRQQLYLHLHALPFIDLLNARPIMAWVGEKGSGKTVIERSIGRFIYGPEYTESTMPDDKDDFLAKVTNQALAFIDNYDDGVEWGNDVLAAIATGTGIDKRELYTTNSLRREVPRCWLSLTSRDPPFRRDDVADRTLVFRVERVEDGFVGTGAYLRQVEAHRDLLWSAYLDNLQRVIAEYDRRDTDSMASEHRMADWAIMAKVIAESLGVDRVDELLETMATERASFALENEPWASVIGKWVREAPDEAHPAEERKASELVEIFEDRGEASGPLGSAPALGSKLVTYRDELGALYGLEIDETGRSNQYRFEADGETVSMAGRQSRF